MENKETEYQNSSLSFSSTVACASTQTDQSLSDNLFE